MVQAKSDPPRVSSIPGPALVSGARLLVLGTAGGQALVVLVSPILTRIYSPEDFGAFGVYVALLAFIALVANLRYELAVPLPSMDVNARALLTLSLVAAACTCLATTAWVAFHGDAFARWVNAPLLASCMWVIPVVVLILATHKALLYWALREKSFNTIASIRLQQGAGAAGGQAMFGLLQFGILGLIAGHLLGYAIGLVTLLIETGRSARQPLKTVSVARLKHVAWRYRRFPLYSTWSDMANVAGTQLPPIILSSLFSPLVAGLYVLAQRVANAPAALVAEALGKAFMATAATARNGHSLPALTLAVLQLLSRLAIGPLLILAVVAPEFFALVFGSQWAEGGRYVQLTTAWLAAVFVFAPLSTLYAVLEQQRIELFFQVALLVSRLGGLFVGALVGGPLLAIGLYSVTAAIVYLGFGAWLLRKAGVTYKSTASTILCEVAFAVAVACALYALKYLLSPSVSTPHEIANLVLLSAAGILGIGCLARAKSTFKQISSLT